MPSFGPLRLALSPPPRPCGPGCSTLSPLPARFRLPVLGPLSLSPPAFFSHKHHFASAAGTRPIILPAPPIVSTGNYAGFFSLDAVERRHSACLSYCASRPASAESASCPTWLSLHPHPFSCFAATAADYCSASCGRGSAFARCLRRLLPSNKPSSATDEARAASIPAREASVQFVHPRPAHPKVPALSCRRQPPRRVPPRNGKRLFTANLPLLPGKQPPHPKRLAR